MCRGVGGGGWGGGGNLPFYTHTLKGMLFSNERRKSDRVSGYYYSHDQPRLRPRVTTFGGGGGGQREYALNFPYCFVMCSSERMGKESPLSL